MFPIDGERCACGGQLKILAEIALSDAGSHLICFCDAGFGLHFLSHWVW